VHSEQLQAISDILKERGPILQARPIRTPTIAALYTDLEGGQGARHPFESIMHQRLEPSGEQSHQALRCGADECSVAAAFHQLRRLRASVILVASARSRAGPEEVIGRAMIRTGANVERFLAPVEPGNLFLMSYKDDVPIISAPGCF